MVRGRAFTVVAIAMAIFVVTATPAGAADVAAPNLSVASEHTTDSDFSNAPTTTNLSITGSGTSAYMELEESIDNEVLYENFNTIYAQNPGGNTNTIFSGGDINVQGVPVDWDGDGVLDIPYRNYDSGDFITYTDINGNKGPTLTEGVLPGGVGDIDGDGDADLAYRETTNDYLALLDTNGNVDVLGSETASNVGGMGDFDGDGDLDVAWGDNNAGSHLMYTGAAGNTFNTTFQINSVGIQAVDTTGDGIPEVPVVRADDNAVGIYDFATDSFTPWGTATGVNVGGMGDADGDGDIDIAYVNSNGDVAITDSGGNVQTFDSATNPGAIYDIDGDSETKSPGHYVSQTHDAEQVTEGWVNLTLSGVEATVTWEGYDGSSWAQVDQTTHSTTGNFSQDLSGGYSEWRIDVLFNTTGSSPTAKLHDEGVLFDASAPSFGAGSATPTGTQSSQPTNLSIDVDDDDFGLPQGDEVEVDFEVKGPTDGSFSSVGSDTLTSNGTASTSISATEGGQFDWRATATDEYGESTTSQTFEFELPSTISIYNETDTAELVDDVNATIRFYANTTTESPLTVTRTTDNGTISMEGLPVTESMIVTAEAPGFVSRRIFLESVFETSNIYLLNETVQHTQTIFDLQDYTGAYPQGATVLEIQRALNGSWETVAGDYFGANNQFPAQLAFNTRHRLIIRNIDTGESRILGTYTPIASTSETMIISPDEPVPEPDEPPGIDVRPGTRQLPTRDGVSVNTTVERGETPLANYSVSLTHVNQSGNTTLATLNGVNGSGETLRESLDLSGVSDGEVVVVASVTTSTGTVVVERVHYDLREVYDDTHTLIDGLNGLVSLAGSTAGTFTAFLAFVMTIVGTAAVATQFRLSSEMVGLIGVGWVATFATIGWVSYDLLFAVLVAWAALSYLGRVY